jgi:hypothetical protein
LLNVQSHSPRRCTAKQRRFGAQLETNTWPIRLLLECSKPFQRACVAGALLFLPSGRGASLGIPALYRTQSGTSLHRGISAGLALVFRGGPLRYWIGRPVVEHGCLGAPMSSGDWHAYLQATQHQSSLRAIRDSTYSGRPLGSPEFIRALERQAHRPFTRRKPGPKKRSESDQQQAIFSFDPF